MTRNQRKAVVIAALTVVGTLLWGWNLRLQFEERSAALWSAQAAERQQKLEGFEQRWQQSFSEMLLMGQAIADDLSALLKTDPQAANVEASLADWLKGETPLQSVTLVGSGGSAEVRLENWGGRVRPAPLRLPESLPPGIGDLRPGRFFIGSIELKSDRGILVQPWTPVLEVWTATGAADGGRRLRFEFRMASLLAEAEALGLEIVDQTGHWIAGGDLSRRWGDQLSSGRQLAEESPELWQAMGETWRGWRGDGENLVVWRRLSVPGGFRAEVAGRYQVLAPEAPVVLKEMLSVERRRAWLLFGGGSILWGLAVVSLIQFMCHCRQRANERAESAMQLLQASPFAVCIKTADGRLDWGNPEFDRLVNGTESGYRGKSLAHLFVEEDRLAQESERDLRFLNGSGGEERSEVTLTPRGRQPRHFIIRRVKFKSQRKRQVCLCWMLVDVTRVRQLEVEAERLGKQMQDLTSRLPGVVFQARRRPDGELSFEYVSAVASALIGIGSEAFEARPQLLRDAVLPEDRKRFDSFLESLPGQAEDETVEFRILDGAGQLRWLRLQAATERLETEEIRFFGYFYDISEEKRREGERRHTMELLQTLFDHSPDMIFCKDRESRLITANDAWIKNFAPGMSLKDVVGKPDSEFFDGSTAELLFESEQELMRQGKVDRRREEHRQNDGTFRYLESVKLPLFDEQGQARGLVGISRDVTPQVKLEAHLRQAKQEAEASTRAKSEFLAVMSHEIRTPMNGVIGAASLLGRTELDERQQNLLRTIRVSGENLLVIINDILDYSKIEAGRVKLEQTAFPLSDLVADLGDLLALQAANKGLELALGVDPQVPDEVVGDPVRLRQVLLNLLGNAVKFTETGEIRLSISLDFLDGKKRLAQLGFEVADTGIGIPASRQQDLFKPFSQVDSSNTRRHGGTGLGLVICQRLVGMMGGRIELQSKPGEGSRFYFSLQLPVPPEFSAGRRKLIAPSLQNKRVLVVDDSETNLGILKGHLSWWGVVPLAFSNPESALREMEQGLQVDAAILDFQMPGMDGEALSRALRALPDAGHFPILVLSSVDEDIKFEGIQGRMMKPIHPKRLLTWLEHEVADETAVAKTDPVPEVAGDGGSESERNGQLKLLVAEDNEINQEVILEMLRQLGFEPVLATNGKRAMEIFKSEGADLIFMDIQMPVMDGLQATREIRKWCKDFSAPWIVALTAGAMEADRERAREAGVNDYLTKPLVFNDLKAAAERGARKVHQSAS